MEQVRETLDTINAAWRQKNFSAMEPFLDENIVMKGPGLKEYAKGRLAFIESYAQFMANSHVTEYEESGNAVDIWGNVAAASYDWSMTYEQKGKTKTDKGHDMFVFHRVPSGWAAVLRLILF
ncbi:MAG: nuclear transport factor 2 family protein [Terriglobales bacterium]